MWSELLRRFEAYDIDALRYADRINFSHSIEYCLNRFLDPAVVYGIMYHKIEDAYAKMKEFNMTHRHAINYAMKSARGRADHALEEGWVLTPYERHRSARPVSALVQVIRTQFGFVQESCELPGQAAEPVFS